MAVLESSEDSEVWEQQLGAFCGCCFCGRGKALVPRWGQAVGWTFPNKLQLVFNLQDHG